MKLHETNNYSVRQYALHQTKLGYLQFTLRKIIG